MAASTEIMPQIGDNHFLCTTFVVCFNHYTKKPPVAFRFRHSIAAAVHRRIFIVSFIFQIRHLGSDELLFSHVPVAELTDELTGTVPSVKMFSQKTARTEAIDEVRLRDAPTHKEEQQLLAP